MSLRRRHFLQAAGLALVPLAATTSALAQAPWPARQVTIVVSYPAGGDTDLVARAIAEKLSPRLKVPVLVDNRPGAAGTVGNTYVSKAPADGYTLLLTPKTFTTAQMVLKLPPGAGYDVLNGFDPIVTAAYQPLILVANPQAGYKTVPEMVAAAKGGKNVTYASPGSGSPMHIVGEWLNREAGVKMQHVPYKGIAPSVTDVVAGHVNTAWLTPGVVSQYVQDKRLVPLAIADAKRSPLVPTVPTLVEAGYKDIVNTSWMGLFAPKGTPPQVLATLNSHVNEILKMPDVAEKIIAVGSTPGGGTPELLGKLNADEFKVMGKVIKDLAITAD
ncbi:MULTISPECIES: Bug family tripartite tricarboxylate transporter substrate binding protein [Ramlibacter]|uniref:Tripartite tricarboxylate transporter substrate binding protein n=1 Tax=Ramlibacter pinisoli TaxID=2682844 RepID=A0A6N8IUU8_9BURK|nr:MULTISPECIES: tripartite tricarboxylate transporter substrate binding protein [Ramlibacter]MBA2964955.1 tripartite tricarboxylate transporter substrate binding protein [Ramlibacter sp. CGMCC 1.13660]MVQ29920.1 tripartite tricarboxylate transporter substrate binding protein [Ramlibacter pinisoli]